MSKPITATAVLMLMEEGRLSLDDPIAKYVPELAGLKTADGKTRESRCGTCSLTPPEWEKQPTKRRKPRARCPTWCAFAQSHLRSRRGANGNTVSPAFSSWRIVEIVSGVPFEVFLRKRIFDPLGMKDTTFYLTAAQMPRWVIPAKREGENWCRRKSGFSTAILPPGRPLPGKQRWLVLNRSRLHAPGPNAA